MKGLRRATLAVVLLGAAAARSGELTGAVTDAESGAPLEGATVTLESPRGALVATTTTDSAGRWWLRGVNEGAFVVRATAPGHEPCYHGGDRVRGAAVAVRGTEPAAADIALPRAAELSGTVWRADGTALHPGYVWLIRDGSPPRYYSIPIAADGTYRADDLPAGDYRVRALTYDPVARQLVSPDWDHPAPVTLTVGMPMQVDMRMEGDRPEPNWVGLVTDEAGRPLPGVQLMVLRVVTDPEGGERTEHVSVRRTDAQGRCSLDGLPPGRYRVSTTDVPPPHAPWRNPDGKARGADVYARHFEIAPEGQAVTEMQLAPGRTLRVSLRDTKGAAAAGDAAVSLVLWHRGDAPFGGDGFSARPQGTRPGRLEVRGLLPAARYEVRLDERDDRARWCVVRLAGAPGPIVAVPATGDPAPLEVRLRRCPPR